MDKNKILKQMDLYDEDFKLYDYTPDELELMLNPKKNTKITFKEQYFSFYDDVKSSSLKKQDW